MRRRVTEVERRETALTRSSGMVERLAVQWREVPQIGAPPPAGCDSCHPSAAAVTAGRLMTSGCHAMQMCSGPLRPVAGRHRLHGRRRSDACPAGPRAGRAHPAEVSGTGRRTLIWAELASRGAVLTGIGAGD